MLTDATDSVNAATVEDPLPYSTCDTGTQCILKPLGRVRHGHKTKKENVRGTKAPACEEKDTDKVHKRACHPCTLEPRDASGWTVWTETEQEPVAMEASCACVGHPCTPEPRDASGRTVRTETEQEPVAMEASCACVGHLCTPDPRNVAGWTSVSLPEPVAASAAGKWQPARPVAASADSGSQRGQRQPARLACRRS
ncbi:unnamed protein product [Gadus morhua 'NCC']